MGRSRDWRASADDGLEEISVCRRGWSGEKLPNVAHSMGSGHLEKRSYASP